MSWIVEELVEKFQESELIKFWPAFEAVAYAVFDDQFAYVFNHPEMQPAADQCYEVIPRDEQFVGCSLILFRGYPTAIVDLHLYDDFPSLYAILAHELFHGFQYVKNDQRMANEVIGATYPLDRKNIEERSMERHYLSRAFHAENLQQKKQQVANFIAVRELRKAALPDSVAYERAIETLEGPAWYVELKALALKSGKSLDLLVAEAGQALVDPLASSRDLRKSCYDSGLFICLLLDDCYPSWQEAYWGEETIDDLLKKAIGDLPAPLEACPELEAEPIIEFVLKERQEEITSFFQKGTENRKIEGTIQLTGFDPMNVVIHPPYVLHKNFLKVVVDQEAYFFEHPTLAYCPNGFREIEHLQVRQEDIRADRYD